MQEHAVEHLVTIGEDIGLDAHRLADHALDREPPAVDLRKHALDDDATPSVEQRRQVRLASARGCLGHSLTRASGHVSTLAAA